MRKLPHLILFLFGLLCLKPADGQVQYLLDSTIIQVSPLIENLLVPWEIAWGPDGKLWVTHDYGTISSLDASNGAITDLVQVSDIYAGHLTDARMMGLAFHPDFGNFPFVYTNYTYRGTPYLGLWDKYVKIVRYTFDASQETLVNPIVLLDSIRVYSGWHVGGKLLIGPDEKIYMTIGDANQPNKPQDHPDWNSSMIPKSLSTDWYSGKVIRLNLDGSVPINNPFAEAPYAPIPKNYIWSLGHRNTQGLVWGEHGQLYYSEHGPANDDELGIIVKGGNYGWPKVEGYCDLPNEVVYCDSQSNIKEPIYTWDTPIAPSNMAYYPYGLIPEWKGAILLATLTGTNRQGEDVRVLHLADSGRAVAGESIVLERDFLRIRDLAVSDVGNVFFTSSNIVLNKGRSLGNDDIIFRVDVVEPNEFLDITVDQEVGVATVNLTWNMTEGGARPTSFKVFRKAGEQGNFISLIEGPFSVGFAYDDPTVLVNEHYAYFVEATYLNDSKSYSDTVGIEVQDVTSGILLSGRTGYEIFHNPTREELTIKSEKNGQVSLSIIALDGRRVYSHASFQLNKPTSIPLTQEGVYFLMIDRTYVKKVIFRKR